ncbi:MAG: hypothetical protein CMP22_02700 [Rickettsiales bacterium]|nr:hypothetical protein [Rickettsiales bacterium]|tara:strand:- start:2156 stop:3391 length:1236 start_codon:yes stop_codon:yes gene_type:complete
MIKNLLQNVKEKFGSLLSKYGYEYSFDGLRKPNRMEIIISAIATCLIFVAIFAWVYISAETTLEKREARVPSIYTNVTLSSEILEGLDPEQVTKNDATPDPDTTPIETQTQDKVVENEPLDSTQQTPEVETTLKTPTSNQISDNDKVDPIVEQLSQTPPPQANLDVIPNQPVWQKNAKDFTALPRKNRIAVILRDIGFQSNNLDVLLTTVPNTTTLALNPYSETVERDSKLLRRYGYEYLMMLPMEPIDYPVKDPGAKGLLTTISRTTNLERLDWILSKSNGYIGVINHMGGAFLRSSKQLEPIFEELKGRQFVFVNSLGLDKNIGQNTAQEKEVPYMSVDLIVDSVLIKEDIERQLRSLELLADEFGYAVGIIDPYPLSIKTYAEWSEKINRSNSLQLVPFSNLLIDEPK